MYLEPSILTIAVLERLYEINEGNIDREQFARLLKQNLKQNKVNVKDRHVNEVLDIIFGILIYFLANEVEKEHTRNLRELMKEYGITSADLTISIGSSLKIFLERCKTLKVIDEGIDKELTYETKPRKKVPIPLSYLIFL